MVGFLSSLVIATVLGFLAGLGVGGGSLLLLWLTQVCMIAQPQARIINLLFYLPAALASSLLRVKHKRIEKKIVIPGILAGCISGITLSILSRFIDVEMAKKLLGGLLIAIGIREIFYRPRKAK